MPDILIAASLAPFVVLPVCLGAPAAWRVVVRWHLAMDWSWRLVVLGFLIGAAANLARLMGR